MAKKPGYTAEDIEILEDLSPILHRPGMYTDPVNPNHALVEIIDNSAANYALTGPTGVFNYTAAPGQIGFPSSVAAAPLPEFPAGALAPVRSPTETTPRPMQEA